MAPEQRGNSRYYGAVLVLVAAIILVWLNSTQSINVALGRKTVTQSSTFRIPGESDIPTNAVDGQYNKYSHTNYVANDPNYQKAWWQVDLGREYSIAEIKIWNRKDECCPGKADCCPPIDNPRLINYTVLVLNANKDIVWSSLVSGVSGVPPTPSHLTTLPVGKRGQYVRVELNKNYLTLAEVEVFADVTRFESLYR
jgi:hypothetical protein